MKKLQFMACPKLCTAVLLGTAALFTASCAKSEFDENEAFVGTIHGGDALTSPDAATFKVKSSSDRSMQTVSWAAVKGALDYKVWIYESDSEFPESGNPGDEYLIVKDSLVHNPYVTIDRAKSKYYYMRVLTAENKAENNPGASTETTYPWDTFLIEISVPGDEENGGGDFYKFLQKHPISEAIAENGGKNIPIAYYFKSDIDYTMSDAVDFTGYDITLMSETDDKAKMTFSPKSTFMTDNNLTIENMDFNCTDTDSKPFVSLNKTPTGPKNAKNMYTLEKIILKDIKIKDLAGNLFYDNKGGDYDGGDSPKNGYSISNFTISNCVIYLETQKVNNEALIALQGSNAGVKDFVLENSTIYGNGDVAKFFLRYSNGARNDRLGFPDGKTTFTYTNNTFYKLLNSEGQWFNGSGVKNNSNYVVKGNIWVDCGKGETARRLLGGGGIGSGCNAEWADNTYWQNGKAVDQSQYDTSAALTTSPGFANPGNGDFTLAKDSEQYKKKTGDPRWIPAE